MNQIFVLIKFNETYKEMIKQITQAKKKEKEIKFNFLIYIISTRQNNTDITFSQ